MNKIELLNNISRDYKVKFFFIILFCWVNTFCKAQPVEFNGKIDYTLETLLASGGYKESSQTYTTYFNQTYQCAQQILKSPNFDSLNNARLDNLVKAYNKYGIEKDSFELAKEKNKLKKQLEESYKKNDRVDQTINKFISYNSTISLMPIKVGEDAYCVVDSLVKINWILLEDTMTIEGLFCQKARGLYNNLFYEVWFAPSIPFAAGPVLMYGLPGIIVMATSEDKKRRYRMTKIEYPLSKNIQLANCENDKKISWKDYKELMAKHKIERKKKLDELMKTPPRQ
jgi:GLPGLI family protein